MIKINPKIRKAIGRFPMVYRLQAEQACVESMSDAINITADASIMACLLALVEDFGWGTSEKATRIPKFIEAVQKNMDSFAERDGDAFAEGMRARLHKYGLDYERKNNE